MQYDVNDILNSLRVNRTGSRWGIGTALQYVKSIEPCLSGGHCPTKLFGLASGEEWTKALGAAATQLVYCEDSDPELISKSVREGASITPGAVLEFDCFLSTKQIDRDGDLVEPIGMDIDPNMPLLWQHIQAQPIGKYLRTITQCDEFVKSSFAIADTELGRDSATLVKFGAMRMSHGFFPTEFRPREIVKGADGQNIVKGWHVPKSSVMEGSNVSIPSNVGARITSWSDGVNDGIATAYSRGKFYHPVVKSMAHAIFSSRPSTVNVPIDLSDIIEKASAVNLGVKAGKVLSSANHSKVAQARDLLNEVIEAAEASAQPQSTDVVAGGSMSESNKSGAAELATKDGPQLATKVYGVGDDYLSGSFEWLSHKLRRTAANYLKARNVEVSDNEYVMVVATFSDRAILCVSNYRSDTQRCFEVSWKSDGSGTPIWDGDPKSVEIKTEVVAKSLNEYELVHKSSDGGGVWATFGGSCDECSSMNGKPARVWKRKYPDGPPAHPNCKCEIIDEKDFSSLVFKRKEAGESDEINPSKAISTLIGSLILKGDGLSQLKSAQADLANAISAMECKPQLQDLGLAELVGANP